MTSRELLSNFSYQTSELRNINSQNNMTGQKKRNINVPTDILLATFSIGVGSFGLNYQFCWFFFGEKSVNLQWENLRKRVLCRCSLISGQIPVCKSSCASVCQHQTCRKGSKLGADISGSPPDGAPHTRTMQNQTNIHTTSSCWLEQKHFSSIFPNVGRPILSQARA